MAEVNAKVISKTQEVLGKHIKKPPLTEKLLKKPPFRFLHDLIKAVNSETGFFDGLYTPEELNSDLIKDKDAKTAFLQKAISVLSIATGEGISAKPSKIVAGHEVDKTNEFLQALGKALTDKVSTADAVARVLGGEKPSEKKKGKEKAPPAAKTEKAPSSKTGAPAAKGKTDPGKKKPAVGSTAAKAKENKTTAGKASTQSEDKKKQKIPGKDVTQRSPLKEAADVNGFIQNGELGIDAESSPVIEDAADDLLEPPPEVSISGPSRPMTAVKDVVDTPIPRPDTSASMRGSLKSSMEQRPPSQMIPTFDEEPVRDARSAMKSAIGSRSVSRINTAVSRAPSGRPRTGRPASARPAPPRVRDKTEFVDDESLHRPQTGRVANVMLDIGGRKDDDDDEDANFIVQETGKDPSNDLVGLLGKGDGTRAPEEIDGEHGALVSQILATKSEFEQQVEPDRQRGVEIERAEGAESTGFGAREREAMLRDVASTQKAVQGLTRVANPLAHLMEYLQEDVEAMNRELEQWTREKNQCNQLLKMQQREMDQGTEPLKLVLQELETSIIDQLDKISAVKSAILKNEERIQRLLRSTGSSAKT